MKTSISIKITALILALSFAVPSSYALYPAQPVEAQAGTAAACAAGLLVATGLSVPGWLKEVIGVPDGNGNTGQNLMNSASTYSGAFINCVLKPLAKIMIITLIRNIGSSIVDWVNSGFNGSPSFVTDLQGTLLDAADEAAGTFIEGSELGFLCNDFGFKIRLALALRYSQSFRQRSQCTLTKIGNNIETNGGAGWDNFLQVTTEPQNNEYGAFIIADSELAARMAKASGIQEKTIGFGQGFLSFSTCDDLETQEEANQRYLQDFKADGSSGSGVQVQTTNVNANSFGKYDAQGNQISAGTTDTKTKTVFSNSATPICRKKTIKTPGSVIAGKLNSTFAQGDIQAAVATEIDDVIAATMNQLAQKVITGAKGLLGLSRKRSTTQSYLAKYQNQFYGANGGDTGATSPIEDYQVPSYDAAAALINNDQQAQQIYDSTNVAAGQAVAQQQAQQAAIDGSLNSSGSEQNFALLKTASESSLGAGPASNAVNGIKDGAMSQYNPPAGTGEEPSPWWQVDLGSGKPIKEIRIWKVTSDSDAHTLGTIHVIASDGPNNNVWTSDAITPNATTPNPIVIPVGLTRQFVRIEKQGDLDNQCRLIYDTTYESCYHPLQLAEVEVIGTPTVPTIPGTSFATSTTSTASTPADDGIPAASTLAWMTATAPTTVSASAPLLYELHLTEQKALTVGNGVTIKSYLQRNGSTVPYLSVFSAYDFLFGTQNGGASTYSITPSADGGSFTLTNVTNDNPANYYIFRQTGAKKSGAMAGSYTIKTTVEDSSGTVLKTATASFLVQ